MVKANEWSLVILCAIVFFSYKSLMRGYPDYFEAEILLPNAGLTLSNGKYSNDSRPTLLKRDFYPRFGDVLASLDKGCPFDWHFFPSSKSSHLACDFHLFAV